MIEFIKRIVPDNLKKKYNKNLSVKQKQYIDSLPRLSIERFKSILTNDLGLVNGDVVFIHSSTAQLNLEFPTYSIIPAIMEILGDKGTILFPTYPKASSYKFLKSKEVFDIKKTPSYTGILTEYARRSKGAVRSLHPTKSVVAIGHLAHELTNSHPESPYPYDKNSPYYKFTQHRGKVIGLGVKTTYLSCVHCIDDILKDKYPVQPYHKQLFEAMCKNYEGETVIVKTYAHNMSKMHFDLPVFMKKHIAPEICQDINIEGMNFFRANAGKLLDSLMSLALDNITIYKKRYYKWNKIL